MKKEVLLVFAVFLAISLACAHQPRYVMNHPEDTIIDNAEVSQAFYAQLSGNLKVFLLNSDVPFNLYVSIVVPEDGRTDFDVLIKNSSSEIALLNGTSYTWTKFYEEFAGDNYLSGPEFDESVPAGNYMVVVSNKDNAGKFSLATGKKEVFSVKDLLVLPIIKKEFFGKSYFAAFQGIIGNGVLLILIFIAIVLLSIRLTILRHRKKKKNKKEKKEEEEEEEEDESEDKEK